ncbi:MAG: PAS-domain containing protein, partial [Actinobacteria bacterium]|nr:PAS-domain containing protein [Actinomycetota bacterium]
MYTQALVQLAAPPPTYSSSPENAVRVGVRAGSELTKCRIFSSTGSAIWYATLSVDPVSGLVTVRLPVSRSSCLVVASVRDGLPVTQSAGAGSLWIANGVVSLRCVASRPGRLTFTSERVRPDGRVIRSTGGPMPGGGYVTAFADTTEEARVRSE